MSRLLHRLSTIPILRRLVDDQQGQSLTEFALVVPLLFIVLFGVIDFGKAMNYWNDETQLAATGARLAVVNYTPASGTFQAYVQQQADTRELRSASVWLSAPNGTARGQTVTVCVYKQYTWLPIIGSILPAQLKTITIKGAATMRIEATTVNWATGSGGTPAPPSGATCP